MGSYITHEKNEKTNRYTEKKSNEQITVDLFRSAVRNNKKHPLSSVIDSYSDEEILFLINASAIPLSLSATKVKSIVYSWIMLSQDRAVIKKMLNSLQEIYEHKLYLNTTQKKMVSFFLLHNLSNRRKIDYDRYLKAMWGFNSKTYFDKKYSQVEYNNFVVFYNTYIKAFLNKIKLGKIKKFPNLRIKD